MRRRGMFATVSICVIALVFGGALVLHQVSSADGGDLLINGPSSIVEVNGLTLSLRVASGPYFLSELLAVRLTLTNASQTTDMVQGMPTDNACDQTMYASLTGGHDPTYTSFNVGEIHCPFSSNDLHPGQAWSFVQFLPLTASGNVEITAQTGSFFTAIPGPDGSTDYAGNPGPFADHFPALHITVAPVIPPDHTIVLRPSDTSSPHSVSILAPLGARSHLYYMEVTSCQIGPGGEYDSIPLWQPITSTMLNEPTLDQESSCTPGSKAWSYAVAAPGYAIASGSLSG